MEQPLHPKDVSVAVAPEIEMPTVPRSKGGGGPSATPLTKNSAPQPSPQPHSPASSLPGLQAQQPRQPSLLPPRRNLYLLTAAVAAFLCAAFVAAGIIVSNAVANAEADNLKAEFSSLCELQSTKIESFAGGRAQLTLLLARSIEALPDPPPRPIMHNLLLSAAGIFASKNPTLALDSTAALFLQYTDAANISEAMDVYRRQYDANDPGKYALYDIRVSNGPITVLPFNSSNTEAFIGTHTSRMPPGLTPTATQARQTALFFNQYSDPDTAAFIDYAVATGEVVSPRPRITIRGVRSLIIAAAVYYTNNTEAVPAFPPGRAFVRGLATTLLWNSTWYAETDQSPLIWWDMVDIEAEFVLVSAQQRQPLRDFRIDGVELRERTLFTQLNRAYAIHCYPTQALVDLYLTNTADALLVVFLVIALLGVFATLFAGYFVRRSTVSRFRLLEVLLLMLVVFLLLPQPYTCLFRRGSTCFARSASSSSLKRKPMSACLVMCTMKSAMYVHSCSLLCVPCQRPHCLLRIDPRHLYAVAAAFERHCRHHGVAENLVQRLFNAFERAAGKL